MFDNFHVLRYLRSDIVTFALESCFDSWKYQSNTVKSRKIALLSRRWQPPPAGACTPTSITVAKFPVRGRALQIIT